MLITTESSTASIVRRADNPNRLALEHIDADVAEKIAALGKSDESYQKIAAEVVVAGVHMYQLSLRDPDAWLMFKKPFDIRVKGEDREYREVAALLWRNLSTEPRERRQKRSLYGLAIATAEGWYNDGLTEPEELVAKILNTKGGLKAVAKLRKEKLVHDASVSAKDRPITVRIKCPSVPTLFVITPDGEKLEVASELAAPVLAEMWLTRGAASNLKEPT
jgi:hypothetical protein